MVEKKDIINMAIFLFCTLIAVVMFLNKQLFLATAFVIASIGWFFYMIVEKGDKYVEESIKKVERGEIK